MHTYRLDRLITIEKEATTKNALGTPVETYSFLKKKFATVTYNGGGTRNQEHGEIANTTAEFTTRYDTDINYKCRIRFNGSYYKILHIEMIGRNEGQRMKTIMFEDE